MREELRIKSAAGPNAELLDLLFEKPYCRINDVVSRCGISRPTATKWLNDFSSNQRLTQIKIGREWLFINHRFIELLAS
jgi:Fic family protein